MTGIDAHAHLWQRNRTPQSWIDPNTMAVIDRDFWLDDLEAMQAGAGIDGSVLVQSANSAQETIDLLAAAKSECVLGVVGWVDLEADVPAQLEAIGDVAGSEYLVGIRHLAHQDPDPEWLLRPTLDFRTLADRDLTFDLVVHARQLEAAACAVRANPLTRFVLDHLGNPPIAGGDLRQWRVGVTLLAELDNVVIKLSGITAQAEWQDWSVDELREPVETALALFGPTRMMFGSDWPVVDLASDASTWVEIVHELIPAEHHDAVFSGTTARVYLGAGDA